MLKEQCISVTDLRTKTKEYLESLKESEKYIFVNNKPRAVLMDIDEYENLRQDYRLQELPLSQVTPAMKKLVEETRKMDPSEFVNI